MEWVSLICIGPPCAPWCTMQVGGAQCRSVVHNIVVHNVGLTTPPPLNTHTHINGTDSIMTADAGGNNNSLTQWTLINYCTHSEDYYNSFWHIITLQITWGQWSRQSQKFRHKLQGRIKFHLILPVAKGKIDFTRALKNYLATNSPGACWSSSHWDSMHAAAI